MPEIISERITAHRAILFMRLAEFIVGVYQAPAAGVIAAEMMLSSQVFGPLRDVTIEDPLLAMKQTAYGDPGEENYPTRKGTWDVRIEAGYDISGGVTVLGSGHLPVYGDFRWGSLMHQTVEFLIARYQQNTLNPVPIVFGVGVFQGGVIVPAAEGGSICRDIRLTRRFGGVAGNLKWANIQTGAFA